MRPYLGSDGATVNNNSMKRDILIPFLLLCLVYSCKPKATLYSDGNWGVYVYNKGIQYQSDYEGEFQIIPHTDKIPVYEMEIGETGGMVKKRIPIPVSDLFNVDNSGNIPNPDISARRVYDSDYDVMGIELYSKTRWPGKVLLFINETKEYYLFPVGGIGRDPERSYYVPYKTPINNPYLKDYFKSSDRHYLDDYLEKTYYAQVVYNTTSKKFELNKKTFIRLLLTMEETPGDVNGKETAKLIYKKCEPSIKASELTRKANAAVKTYGFPDYDTILADYKRNSIMAENTYYGNYYFYVLTLGGISRSDSWNGKYYVSVDNKTVGGFYTDDEFYARISYPTKVLISATLSGFGYSWPEYIMVINGSSVKFWGFVQNESFGQLACQSPEGVNFYVKASNYRIR